jgi:molybdopterin-containing oxidoreductase family iron-sulfur binding subunit
MSATASLRQRFAGASPARFWRSLGELSGTPSFRVQLAREFPDIAARFGAATDRRTALKLLGASLLMAGVAACKAPVGIAPYVDEPEAVVPGRPRFYATSVPIDGYAMGVLAESHDGRPTKIEGNPLHPGSLGGTDAIMQASVWSLYDPGRSRVVRRGTEVSTWDAWLAELADLRASRPDGRGIGVVIGSETSPTLARQLAALRTQMPALRLYRHAPLTPDPGEPVPLHDLARAKTVLALDGDFLGEGPGRLAYARAFAAARRVRAAQRTMSRLYAIEAVPSLTGANADWVRRLRPGEVVAAAANLLGAIEDGAPVDPEFAPLLADLTAGDAVVIAGPRADPFVRAAARRLNRRLGAPARDIAGLEIAGDGDAEVLANDIAAGRLEALLILDADLVYSAPPELAIGTALGQVRRVYHHGLHVDATARLAHWHVPAAHYLESWSDLRAYDGTASLVQPLIEPLYAGRTVHEVVAALAGDFVTPARDHVRSTWTTLDDQDWMAALKAGRVEGSAAPAIGADAPRPVSPAAAATAPLDLVLVPDPYLRAGAWAANLPLNELPRPLSKLVWGNAAEIGPALAGRLQLRDGDKVELVAGGRSLALPVFVHPGMPDDVVAVALGWGRAVGPEPGVGTNAFALGRGAVELRPTGRAARLITTQEHHAMEGRDLIREVALPDWPGPPPVPIEQPRLLPQWPNPEEAWGMSIDLTACIGGMACVSACQAENNSPVVGPDEMARGHDMHWLRVDRYYSGDDSAPETAFQPVPCMQCEDAPCEVVCPVNATVHTHDGLNAQVYNRCVGTRYCSQNCPYKVRRFNFFDYNAGLTEDSPLSLLMNPDVTVRERGVMEKCTYCVQRIAEARIGSDIADTPIPDGGALTACQQACPTRAISFGNLNDPAAKVVAEKAEPTSYAMLAELGTRPRTTYLAKVRNRTETADD